MGSEAASNAGNGSGLVQKKRLEASRALSSCRLSTGFYRDQLCQARLLPAVGVALIFEKERDLTLSKQKCYFLCSDIDYGRKNCLPTPAEDTEGFRCEELCPRCGSVGEMGGTSFKLYVWISFEDPLCHCLRDI